MILQKETPIGPDEDAQALTVRLADLGAEALSEAVAAIGNGTAARTPQDESRQTYASMLTKEMSPIDCTGRRAGLFAGGGAVDLEPLPASSQAAQGQGISPRT